MFLFSGLGSSGPSIFDSLGKFSMFMPGTVSSPPFPLTAISEAIESTFSKISNLWSKKLYPSPVKMNVTDLIRPSIIPVSVVPNTDIPIGPSSPLPAQVVTGTSSDIPKPLPNRTFRIQQNASAVSRTNTKLLNNKDAIAQSKIYFYVENGDIRWRPIPLIMGVGTFSKKIARKLTEISSTEVYDETVLNLSDTLNNAVDYSKLLENCVNQSPEGIKLLEQLINQAIEMKDLNDPERGKDDIDRLDGCLMMAAKLGNRELFDKALAGGAALVRDGKLVTDETGKNILHYACQSHNAKLIYDVAQNIRLNAANKTFKYPRDCLVNGQFDPFRLRDDTTIGTAYQHNHLRPMHFLRNQNTLKELDELFGLPKDGAQGSLTSSAAYYQIKNKVLDHGILGCAGCTSPLVY